MKSNKIWTPREVAMLLVSKAKLNHPNLSILEPHIGWGHLAGVIQEHLNADCTLVGIEVDINCVKVARDQGFHVIHDDFLSYHPSSGFDRIIASPPFSKGADILHIQHMFTLLKTGGRLVSVANQKLKHRTDQQADVFWKFLKNTNAEIFDLPVLSFHQFGSDVDSMCIVIDKI